MTSKAKIAANRRNAARSTGPRTPEGKAKSRRNAFVHGLSVAVKHSGLVTAELETLAKPLGALSGAPREIAIAVAQARLELLRVRRTADEIINLHCQKNAKDGGQGLDTLARIGRAVAASLPELVSIERYERRASSRFNKELQRLETHQTVALADLSGAW
jgi:hypothetical protein